MLAIADGCPTGCCCRTESAELSVMTIEPLALAVVRAGMRRFVAPLLLSLSCGCYLFSDEPKARKQPGSEVGEDPSDAHQPTTTTPETPQPEGEVADCPAFLTGTETKARVIASSCAPVRVRGQYRIDGGTLTIEAGVELRFEKDAVLEVGRDRPGALVIAGTPEQPVRLVADPDDALARWQGVRLHAQATGSSLKQVEIAGAGLEDQAALWIAAEQLTLENLTVRNAPALALEIVAERAPTLLGVTLAGTGPLARVSPSAAAGLHDLKLEPTAFVAISSGTIASTIEWPPNPYRIEGVIRIEGDPERPGGLTLAPGAALYFMPEARIVIGGFGPGSLSASASAAQSPDAPSGPITMRAAEDSRAGSWSGIHVQDHGELILRNVELAHGGSRDEGVVIAEGNAKLTLEGCEFHDDLVGVELRGHAVVIDSFTNNGFRATPVAIRTTPALLSGIGPDNRFDELTHIDVSRGKIESDATWTYQAAPILIHGDVFVDKGATLKVAPGVRLGFDPGVLLGVGYYEQATLDMRGTAEAPILLEPIGEPWGGVVLGNHARGTKFEQVRLRKTGNAAGIELREGAEATLVNVACAACANATVTWDCASKIGNIGIEASEGTPTTLAPPTQCK
jgi:hypothetical protein